MVIAFRVGKAREAMIVVDEGDCALCAAWGNSGLA